MKMMKKIGLVLSISAVLAIAMIVAACAPGIRLFPASAKSDEIKGTYTLLLYGCHYTADVMNVAFLLSDHSKYPLDIHDIPNSYRVKKGLTAAQAMDEANSFVRCSSYGVWQIQLLQIPDDSGGTVGYEMRPLYFVPSRLGAANVMDINYYLKKGKVVTYIRMDPNVKRNLESSGSSGRPKRW
jgi:hypothetical protein